MDMLCSNFRQQSAVTSSNGASANAAPASFKAEQAAYMLGRREICHRCGRDYRWHRIARYQVDRRRVRAQFHVSTAKGPCVHSMACSSVLPLSRTRHGRDFRARPRR